MKPPNAKVAGQQVSWNNSAWQVRRKLACSIPIASTVLSFRSQGARR